jgi:hypothetical protein
MNTYTSIFIVPNSTKNVISDTLPIGNPVPQEDRGTLFNCTYILAKLGVSLFYSLVGCGGAAYAIF